MAVKEFLPRSLKADVMHEASILVGLCHPYLPFLLGICTKEQPLRIVMQFHAFKVSIKNTLYVTKSSQ